MLQLLNNYSRRLINRDSIPAYAAPSEVAGVASSVIALSHKLCFREPAINFGAGYDIWGASMLANS